MARLPEPGIKFQTKQRRDLFSKKRSVQVYIQRVDNLFETGEGVHLTRGHDLSRRLVARPRVESLAAKADSESSPTMDGFADGWARHRRSNHVVVTGGFAIESSGVAAREGRGVADSLAAGPR